MDEVWAFYQTVVPWLMSQDYVIAFFPFGMSAIALCTMRANIPLS